MLSRKAMKTQITDLEYRVKTLENILCPCGQHDWVKSTETYGTDGNFERYTIETYMCRKCFKEKTKTFY